MAWDSDALVERVAALKHDLGKYVAWMSVNLDEEAWTGPVSELVISALRSDVLATVKGVDGDRAAWEVWSEHSKDMPRPWDPPQLAQVEDAVAVLQAAAPALRSGDVTAIGAQRGAIRDAQQTIRKALAAAYRTVLARRDTATDGGEL